MAASRGEQKTPSANKINRQINQGTCEYSLGRYDLLQKLRHCMLWLRASKENCT